MIKLSYLLHLLKVIIGKNLVGFDLVELEEAAYLVQKEEDELEDYETDEESESSSASEYDSSSEGSKSSEEEEEGEDCNDEKNDCQQAQDSSIAVLCCELNKLNTEQREGD